MMDTQAPYHGAPPAGAPPRPQGNPGPLLAAAAQLNREADVLATQPAIAPPSNWVGAGSQGFAAALAGTETGTEQLLYQVRAVAQALQAYGAALQSAQEDYDVAMGIYHFIASTPDPSTDLRQPFNWYYGMDATKQARIASLVVEMQNDVNKVMAARHALMGALSAAPRAYQTGGVKYNGGPVQHQPQIYAVFLGKVWSTPAGAAQEQLDKRFFNSLPGSGFQRNLAQYTDVAGHVGDPRLVASVNDQVDTPPPVMDTSQLGSVAKTNAQRYHWSVNGDTQIVVLPPPTTTLPKTKSGATVGGYHNVVPIGVSMVPVVTARYNSSLGHNQTITLSHEYAETATDPYVNPKVDYSPHGWANGKEVGDLCDGQTTMLGNGVIVQPIWNQKFGKCQTGP